MAEALAGLDATYGGIDGYLLGACGLSRATLDRLKAALIG